MARKTLGWVLQPGVSHVIDHFPPMMSGTAV
jgi:hypothetical protein